MTDLAVTRYPIGLVRDVPVPRITIALVADIHGCEPYLGLDRVESIVDQTNALGADMICLLGDYAGHSWGGQSLRPETVASSLMRLEAPLGVHAIFGNHDWKDDRPARRERASETKWHRAFRAAGLAVLVNEATTICTEHGAFQLAGLESQLAFGNVNARGAGAHDLGRTFEGLSPDLATILLAHEPDIFPSLPAHVDLTLCGHTHGGQLRAFGRSWYVPSRFGSRYDLGHFRQDTRQMIVSGGIGTSGPPFRIGMPPEIVLVDLG